MSDRLRGLIGGLLFFIGVVCVAISWVMLLVYAWNHIPGKWYVILAPVGVVSALVGMLIMSFIPERPFLHSEGAEDYIEHKEQTRPLSSDEMMINEHIRNRPHADH